MNSLYRVCSGMTKPIKCIALGNRAQTGKGRAGMLAPPASPYKESYLLFGFFFVPKLVSTLEPMLAKRSLALCAFGPLGAISRYFWNASAVPGGAIVLSP